MEMNTREKGELMKDKILDTIEMFQCMRTDQVAKLIYRGYSEGLRQAQGKLKVLIDRKYLSRWREHQNAKYIYFLMGQKPKQLNHQLSIVDFYANLSDFVQIDRFDMQKELRYSESKLVPDAYLEFLYKGYKYRYFLEVQLSNNPIDFLKYERYQRSLAWQSQLHSDVFPRVVIMCKRKIDMPQGSKVTFMQIGLDCKEIQTLLRR
jgi:hypothetical protein